MPKIIAHRANLTGPNKKTENTFEQISKVLKQTPFDIEIDVWYNKDTDTFYLGHDNPAIPIDNNPYQFLNNTRFWIHAKNFEALSKLTTHLPPNIHIFSHESDPVVLTSTRIPWVYPGHPVDEQAVIVMPENTPNSYSLEQLKGAKAICTDFPIIYASILS